MNRDHLFTKTTKMEEYENPWCLALSEETMDQRDFKAEEAVEIDMNVQLPDNFSLWERVYKTNYQGKYWSCTSNATAHAVQVLAVKRNGIKPKNSNIITPNRKDLRVNMWHDINDVNDSWDYVEKAVETAHKMWIKSEETWEPIYYDNYCYKSFARNLEWVQMIKQYIYQIWPVVRCMRWNKNTWSELTRWLFVTKLTAAQTTGWHAICAVGFDKWWIRFLNSRTPNDDNKDKSRFYVTNEKLATCVSMFNWRYRVLYNKDQAKKSPEYIKNKNTAVVILKALKKVYPNENAEVKKWIEALSQAYRKAYPEINEELPINS